MTSASPARPRAPLPASQAPSSRPSPPLSAHQPRTRFKPAAHKDPRRSSKPECLLAAPSKPDEADRGWDNAEGFSAYMREKNRKLREQFAAQYDTTSPEVAHPSLFKRVVIWVDGHTTPSRLALRDIIGSHGGRLETYFSASIVTHVVAENLAAATRKRFAEMKKANIKIVTPKWITDSVKRGTKLPERLYTVKGMTDPIQKSIASMFKASSKRKT